MKKNLVWSLASMLVVGTVMHQSAQAQMLPVQVSVDVKNTNSTKRSGGKVTESIDTKKLTIKLRSMGGKKLEGLTVKYYVLAKDTEGKTSEVVGSGSAPADLEPLKPVEVVTEPMRVVYQPSKMILMKYKGYVVKVTKDDKLLGEVYEPKDMKKDFDKAIETAASVVPAQPAPKKK